jgi:hypothetical protein
VDNGGHVGHQEGVEELWKHRQQGGDPIQFRIAESDLSPTRSLRPPCL